MTLEDAWAELQATARARDPDGALYRVALEKMRREPTDLVDRLRSLESGHACSFGLTALAAYIEVGTGARTAAQLDAWLAAREGR